MVKYAIAWGCLLSASLLGCNGGFDRAEAEMVCGDLAADLTSCIDGPAESSCISCHEECGRDCDINLSVCPHTFSCPD